ncbi:hypothetical protein [Patiriisocius sp. Uisw_017]|jgi:hypothetical protein|uniref:hypothetical protein n=1 Tax=Patiriisocius sp. Uisw_017 TaxID=3230968 RepID=UPI0039E86FE8
MAKSLNHRKKKKLTLHDIEKFPAIKIRLDYKTMTTVKDTQQLEKWKERYPDVKIITN